MPIQSSALLRDTANLVGPGSVLANDGYDNMVAGPTTDTLIVANIKIGVVPMSTTRDWIRMIGGGPENLRDYQVAVPGRYNVQPGMAFVVAAGSNPGTYRIKQVTKGFSRTSLALCVCNREK